mgnify:CR=1 FL=1
MKKEIETTGAFRLLAPRPVCLLTTRYRGQVNVMSFEWSSAISQEPPLILMAIHPSRYTHGMLERSEECCLNIPGRPLAEHVWTCGTRSGEDVDKIELTGLTLESAEQIDSPWIDECLAHIECAIVDRLTPGDHSLFIAQVIEVWAEKEAFDNIWLVPENEELLPLQHLGGKTFSVMGERITVS